MSKSISIRSFSLLERTIILGFCIVVLIIVQRSVSGLWLPSSGLEDLWLISGIGLLSFDLLSSPFLLSQVISWLVHLQVQCYYGHLN